VTRALLAALLLLALLPAAAAAQEPRASLPDIEDEVMCVECGTALNISEAPSADRQRAFIRRRIAEGLTKEQIKDALVAEYGRSVLATPPSRGFDAANWLVPVVLAGFAVLALGATARRWRRTTAHGRGEEDGPRIAPEDATRLERDMAGYDL
jgi:cytochrome c-type biogenesis protein CcmH